MDRLGAVAGQRGEMMHFACGAGFHHETDRGAQADLDHVLMHRRTGQQRRDRRPRRVHRAVGNDDDVVTLAHRAFDTGADLVQRLAEAGRSVGGGRGDVHHDGAKDTLGQLVDLLQLGDLGRRENRLAHFQARHRLGLVDAEQVRVGADQRDQRHDNFLADRIDRRIGHLGEQLLEVIEQRLVL